MVAQPILQFDVAYPEHNSRLLIFVKWLLIIPHLIVLTFLGIALGIVTLIAWFAILILGRYPRGMWDFSLGVLRWSANISAYIYLQRDEYPPFSGEADYPVRFQMDYPARLSRWKIFLKWLLIIPSAFVYSILSYALGVVWFISWFAILILGRFPRGLFDFVTGVQRWSHRITVYSFFLTDAYPPFTLGNVPSPTSGGGPASIGGGTYPTLPPAGSPGGTYPTLPPATWGNNPPAQPVAAPSWNPPAGQWGATVPAPAPAPAAQALVCAKCGHDLGPDDIYCGNCGEPAPSHGS